MKRITKSILFAALLSLTLSAAAAQNFLPKTFAGWTQSGAATSASRPEKADAGNAAVLSEYGFSDAETATYTRPDGRTMTVKALRFKDATGAYGAFTFYRDPTMKEERIGTKSASDNERILFFRSNVLVDAKLDRVTGMSAAELRDLAANLPEAPANAANLPNLPEYLPKQGAVENSAKYVLGPQAFAVGKSPLSNELVNFAVDPEILTQSYTTSDGPVNLMLVQYPTPQIAIERLRAYQAAPEFGPGFVARRTGPIIVVESGALGSSDAKALLNSVNYEAEVTWNEATSIAKRDNIGNLMIAVFGLIGILLVFALLFGLFFGGIRVLLTKYFPGTVLDLPENVEILQLHLREGPTADK